MKKLLPPSLTGICAALCIVTASCWLFQKQPITPTVPDGGFADASAGQTFVDCSDAALHRAAVSILPDIETAVAMGPASVDAVVVQLAATVGMPLALAEVACGLRYLVSRITHSQQVAPDSLEATKLANAQAWLRAHPSVQSTNAGSP